MSRASAADIAYQEQHIDDTAIPGIIAANVVCTVGAYVAVALRLFSRRLIRASLKADDWTLIASLVAATLYAIAFCVATRFNIGSHTILIKDSKADLKAYGISLMTTQALYWPPITLVKLSILLLYRRIFPSQVLQQVLIIVGSFVLAQCIAGEFGIIFQCFPFRSGWDATEKGRCIHLWTFILALGVLNIVSDVIILVLPLPSLWHLQITRNRKWLLFIMFSLGGFVCVISIVRAFFLQKFQFSVDPVWDAANALILSIVEICIAIISACLPTYRPLFRYFLCGTAKRPTIGRKSTTEHLNLQYRNTTKSHQRLGMQTKDKATLETVGNDNDDIFLHRLSLE